MSHPHYWRPLAMFGIIAGILLMLSYFSAALLAGEPYQLADDSRQQVATAIVIFATIPDTLNMLFFLGVVIIWIPDTHPLTRYALLIFNAVGYGFVLLGNVLIAVEAAQANAGENSQFIEITNGVFQQSHLLYTLLFVGVLLNWGLQKLLPRWMWWATLVAAVARVMLVVIYHIDSDSVDFILLNTTSAIWVTLVSAFLLIGAARVNHSSA